ncbi:PREDICTED: proline-rich receptor-like protein kinase PERK8 [Priapulus caudatus]|uniref:Proline-rich receptor-like protein kinase PERK8 n=1 Tax=Priapulus caudatus TaxID=37621 RepID=A0ABM1EZF7_PRICU|nr:PREDICTED: proline-rich receptor-like protein kinase PERK8 [Priapulus caudatus]
MFFAYGVVNTLLLSALHRRHRLSLPGPIASPPGPIASLPGSIASPPGPIASPPGPIASPPGSIASPPGSIASPPGSIASPPGSIASLPGPIASLQGSVTSLPGPASPPAPTSPPPPATLPAPVFPPAPTSPPAPDSPPATTFPSGLSSPLGPSSPLRGPPASPSAPTYLPDHSSPPAPTSPPGPTSLPTPASSPGTASPLVSYFSMYVIGTLANQGGTYNPVHAAARLLHTSWWLFVIVMLGLYTGTLVSFLSVRTTIAYPFTNLREAAEGAVVPVVWRGYAIESLLRDSPPQSDFGRLWAKVSADPRATIEHEEQFAERLMSGDYAYIVNDWSGSSLVEQDYRQTGRCRLSIIPVDYNVRISCVVAPESPHKEALNRGIRALSDSGLLAMWQRQAMSRVSACAPRAIADVVDNKLSLSHLRNIFRFLLEGVIAGLLALMGERAAQCLIHRLQRRRLAVYAPNVGV